MDGVMLWQLSGAKREIRYHRMFQHSNLLPLLDSSIQADPGRGPGAAVAYLLFPYLPGGSLRDAIDTHVLAAATPGLLPCAPLEPSTQLWLSRGLCGGRGMLGWVLGV